MTCHLCAPGYGGFGGGAGLPGGGAGGAGAKPGYPTGTGQYLEWPIRLSGFHCLMFISSVLPV